MQEIQFDYFWGMDAEKFSFYRVPKVLFTVDYFKSLSCEAKVLYGLMLDRMGLSIKNQWFDENGRVYIIFTVEEIMELLCCRSQKAAKLMNELDVENGIGLIERRRLGLGKPNIIYVKNFVFTKIGEMSEAIKQCDECLEHKSEEPSDALDQRNMAIENQNFENQKSRILKIKNQEFRKSKIKNSGNQKTRVLKIKRPEFRKSKDQSFENQKSRILKIKNQEFRKSKSNNTDNNNTEFINSYPIYQDTAFSDASSVGDVIERMDMYREIIRENISYKCFRDEKYYKIADVDELVELIVEVMMMPDNYVISIGGQDKPAVIVKKRYMEIKQSHIQYVINCLQKNVNKVRNIKAYLWTTLYNATLTIGSFYRAEVNYNQYG